MQSLLTPSVWFIILYLANRIYLCETLTIAHSDGSFGKLLAQLAKTQLLTIDDWGLDVLTRQQRNDLLEIMEDRHARGSTLITSQHPLALARGGG